MECARGQEKPSQVDPVQRVVQDTRQIDRRYLAQDALDRQKAGNLGAAQNLPEESLGSVNVNEIWPKRIDSRKTTCQPRAIVM
jgi:hypothetical protein